MNPRGRGLRGTGFLPSGICGRFRQDRLERLVIYGQTAFFLFSLGVLLASVGYRIGHMPGVLAVLLCSAALWVTVRPRLPGLLLKRLRAVPMDHGRARGIMAIVEELARRSALSRTPVVYYAPSPSSNAFVAMVEGRSVICLTAGLLAMLSPRELVAVLAHEMSHVRANHAWLMVLSAQVVRVLLLVATAAQVVLWGVLPAMWARGQLHAWLVDCAILLLPTVAAILQLALCRRCELAADRQAALLTGDPGGLMAALRRLDGHERFWFNEEQRAVHSGAWLFWLRSHPSIRTRLEHLMRLRLDAVQRDNGQGARLIDQLLSLSQPPSSGP